LLDHGADPNVSWSDGQNAFTVLTGLIGGGEGGQRAHPQAEALARLLIERGADPFDRQALYNTSLDPDSTLWLELLWSESNKRGETDKWTAAASGFYGASMVDYLLGNAVPRHPRRAEWLLAHGANANAVNAYSKEPVIKHALLAGSQAVVDLLVRHGAQRPVLSGEESFLSAAMQSDAETLRRLAASHPEYRRSGHAMFAAIGQRRTDIAELLLDLGVSPDVADAQGFSALHYTTHCGAAGIATLLIARGANIDPVERRYNSTPLGHANYQGRPEMVAVIAPFSRDIRGLCFAGAIDRLTELLGKDRGLASAITRGGEAPLFALPDDDERAVDVAELLLAHGADPSIKNGAGLTPAEAAKKRGLDEAAATISAAEP
jgi:ankyrin repeat protein